MGEGVYFYIRSNQILSRTVRNRNTCSLMMSIRQNSLNIQLGYCLRMMKRCCFSSPVISLLSFLSQEYKEISVSFALMRTRSRWWSALSQLTNTQLQKLLLWAEAWGQFWPANLEQSELCSHPVPVSHHPHTHHQDCGYLVGKPLYLETQVFCEIKHFLPLQQTD